MLSNKNFVKIEIVENGFSVFKDDVAHSVKWANVDKISGFKLDRITTDEICLRIGSNRKSMLLTEEYEGWTKFLNQLYLHFPSIDNHWIEKVVSPPFERNEIILYSAIANANN